MQFRRADFTNLSYFLEIAKYRNFGRAGAELGISASALSHALRGLEERLGVRLLNRTSRSVTLTAAGEELQTAILEPFDEIGRAVEVVNLKHPLIFYFGLLGECFDRRDSRAFTAFVPEKLPVFQSSNNINSYNQIMRGVLSY